MNNKANNNHFRIIGLYLFVLFISLSVIAKIVKIQQFDVPINTSSQPRFFTIDAPRGNILADDGSLLAISMPLYNVYLDMGVVDDVLFDSNVAELSQGLHSLFRDRSSNDYEQFLRIKKKENNRYVRLRLKVNYNQLLALKKLPILSLDQNIGGLIAEQRPHRETPFGELARRTIGENREVNPVGVERAYDPILSGIDGIHLKRKIAQGVWIPEYSESNTIPKAGKDVMTTINIDMQDVAEKSLERTLVSENADWGCVVLMEVKTGNVKVIANLRKDSLDRVSEYFNYAIAEHVAPGSTFKLASIIAGLEDGKFEVTDLVDLNKGRAEYYDRVMIDSPHNLNKVSIKKAFIISSNVGISKIINDNYKQDPSAFTDRIYKMGLSTPLELELPYPEALSMPIPNKKGWSGVTLPWMSTGYEMALTPLHLLTFYNAIANQGKMMRPIFTTSIVNKGREILRKKPEVIDPSICSRSTIDKVIPLLIGVVEEGTAKNIKSEKYKIAGKTGTTVLNYAGRRADEEKMYQASFAGFFPAENPKYSCIVVINNPKNSEVYGGKVAAPIFKELADKVFALDMDIHEPIHSTVNSIEIPPEVKKGETAKVDFVLQDLGILNMENEGLSLVLNSMENDLKVGKMPDLLGMNLQDVLYSLEKYGFKVEVSGSGSVVRQSIKMGEYIRQGIILKLELA